MFLIRVLLMAICLLGFRIAPGLAFIQEHHLGSDDLGTNDPVLIAKNWLKTQLDESVYRKLSQAQRIQAINMYERQLVGMEGKLPRDAFLTEISEVASLYYHANDWAEANRVYDKLIESAPNSIFAAKALMMKGWNEYGKKTNPNSAVPFLDKSAQILEALVVEEDDFVGRYAKNELTARVRGTLGSVYYITDRHEEAAKQFKYLIDHDDVWSAADESIRINAYSQLSRILQRQGKLDEAISLYSSLDKILMDSDLPDDIKLAFAIEMLQVKIQNGSDERELIEHLEHLWYGGEGLSNGLAALELANNLSLCYFFSKDPEQNSKFLKFSGILFDKAKKVFEADGEIESTKEKLKIFDRICQQNRVMQMRFHERNKESEEFEAVKEEFLHFYAKREIAFLPYVPTIFPQEVAANLLAMYDRFLKEDVSKLNEKQSLIEIPSVLDKEPM